jgi:hypothetical protein
MVAIIPEKEVNKWMSNYESLHDYIVPRSSKSVSFDPERFLSALRSALTRSSDSSSSARLLRTL